MVLGSSLVVLVACNDYVLDELRPELGVEPTSLHFEDVPLGTVATLPVRLSNGGGGVLTGLELELDEPFGVDEPPSELAPGEQVSVDVHIAPEEEGVYAGTLRVRAGDSERREVELFADVAPPELLVEPESLAFEATGALQSERVYLSSVGAGPLVVHDASVEGSLGFSVGELSPEPLAPGEVAALEVSFEGTEGGSSWLTITSNDPAGEQRVALEAVEPPNEPPSAPAVAIDPAEPVARLDDLRCEITEESVDPDGDQVSYALGEPLDRAAGRSVALQRSEADAELFAREVGRVVVAEVEVEPLVDHDLAELPEGEDAPAADPDEALELGQRIDSRRGLAPGADERGRGISFRPRR